MRADSRKQGKDAGSEAGQGGQPVKGLLLLWAAPWGPEAGIYLPTPMGVWLAAPGSAPHLGREKLGEG